MSGIADRDAYRAWWRDRLERLRTVDGEAAATEKLFVAALTYSQALTTTPWFLDFRLRLDASQAAVAESGVDLRGRWARSEVGYVWTDASGESGRYQREPPAGVDPGEIVELPEAEVRVPGRERLGTLVELLESEPRPATHRETVESVLVLADRALHASAAGARDEVWSEWRGAALEGSLGAAAGPSGRQPAGDVLEAGVGVLRAAYEGCGVDGTLVALALVVEGLFRAVDTVAGEVEAIRVAFTGLGPGGGPDAAVAQAVARGLREGHADAVRSVAEERSEAARERIEAALDAPGPLPFYESLHSACPDAWASFLLYRALASPEEHPAGATGFARAFNVSEETWVRLVTSIGNGVRGVEEPSWPRDRSRVQETLAGEGATAARRLATGLIENWWYYPRCMLPRLLQTDEPFAA